MNSRFSEQYLTHKQVWMLHEAIRHLRRSVHLGLAGICMGFCGGWLLLADEHWLALGFTCTAITLVRFSRYHLHVGRKLGRELCE